MKTETVHDFIHKIKTEYTNAKVTSNIASDEAWMVNIKFGPHLFVVEHAGGAGYGVTEIPDGPESWVSGYDHVLPTSEEALACLFDQMNEKNVPEVESPYLLKIDYENFEIFFYIDDYVITDDKNKNGILSSERAEDIKRQEGNIWSELINKLDPKPTTVHFKPTRKLFDYKKFIENSLREIDEYVMSTQLFKSIQDSTIEAQSSIGRPSGRNRQQFNP